VKKEIKNLNKELKNMKNEYYIMEEQNLTYKYMIEKILAIYQKNFIQVGILKMTHIMNYILTL